MYAFFHLNIPSVMYFKYWNVICCSTLCQMAFKSANFLERHRNYSELHQRNLKERDEVEKMKLNQSIKDSLLGMLILPLLLYVLVHTLYYIYYTLPGRQFTYIHTYIRRPFKLLDL